MAGADSDQGNEHAAIAVLDFLRTFLPDLDKRAQLIKSNARRRIYKLDHAGKTLYVKQHLQRGPRDFAKFLFAGSPAKREHAVSRFAETHGVAAVRVLGKLERRDRWNPHISTSVSVSIDAAVQLTQKFAELVQVEDPCERRSALAALSEALVRLIVQAHDHSFLHDDLHPANILIVPVGIAEYHGLFVDLEGVRCGHAVHDLAAARNLAALDQWFRARVSRSLRLRFLKAYARRRGHWPNQSAFKRFASQIEAAARTHARRLFAQRDRRIGRRNAFFDRQVAEDGAIVAVTRRFRRLAELLDVPPPDELAQAPATDAAPSQTSAEVESFYSPNWLTSIAWRVSGSPAWRKYRSACVLMNRDIPTVIPLACRWLLARGGVRQSGWRRQRPAGATTLREWLATLEGCLRAELLEATGRLLADTLARGVIVYDPSPLNIEVTGALRGRLRVFWSGAFVTTTTVPASPHARVWMLAQLARSVAADASISRSDRARVLRTCCRRMQLGIFAMDWRQIWKLLAGEAESGAPSPHVDRGAGH